MSTNPRNVLNALAMGLSAFADPRLPPFIPRSAQQAHDDALYSQCTRCKYTPASVNKAFLRRRKLLNKGLGHHAFKADPYYVNSINNIK